MGRQAIEMVIIDEGPLCKKSGAPADTTKGIKLSNIAQHHPLKPLIAICTDLNAYNTWTWHGKGETQLAKNIYRSIMLTPTPNPLAKGIWACRSSKMSVFLWKLVEIAFIHSVDYKLGAILVRILVFSVVSKMKLLSIYFSTVVSHV